MTVIVNERLFLTADKDRLVSPESPEAAFLWAGEGDEVTDEEAERVGYKGGTKKADEEDAVKAEPAPENKAVEAPEADKATPKPAKRTRKAAKKAT